MGGSEGERDEILGRLELEAVVSSEMREDDKHPTEQVGVGEVLPVVVLSVDIEERKMASSLKWAHG